MDGSTALVVAVIGAVFAGLALLAGKLLPYFRKSPEAPAAREIPVGMPSSADRSGALMALPTGTKPVNTGRTEVPSPPWERIDSSIKELHKTVSENSKSFVSKEELDKFSTTVDDRMTGFEKKLERHSEQSQKAIRGISTDIGYIKGKLDK